jgi:hypothetical protein
MDKCGFDFRKGKGFVSSLNTGSSSREKKLFGIKRLNSTFLYLERRKKYEFKNLRHSQNNQIFIYEGGGKQCVREMNYFQNRDNICTDKVNLKVEEQYIFEMSCQNISNKIQM